MLAFIGGEYEAGVEPRVQGVLPFVQVTESAWRRALTPTPQRCAGLIQQRRIGAHPGRDPLVQQQAARIDLLVGWHR